MAEPRLLMRIQAGSACIPVPSEHALIGARGFFAREVQLPVGTSVMVRFCQGRDEVCLPGIVRTNYAGLGLSVEFKESSALAVQRLTVMLAA